MRLIGSKKGISELLDLGGTEDDIVSLLPEEPEDMVGTPSLMISLSLSLYLSLSLSLCQTGPDGRSGTPTTS